MGLKNSSFLGLKTQILPNHILKVVTWEYVNKGNVVLMSRSISSYQDTLIISGRVTLDLGRYGMENVVPRLLTVSLRVDVSSVTTQYVVQMPRRMIMHVN